MMKIKMFLTDLKLKKGLKVNSEMTSQMFQITVV